MNFFTQRFVVNPVLAVSGSLLAVSGIFLLIHYESHLIQAVHKLTALIILVFCTLHLIINRRALVSSLRGKLVVCAVIVVVCTVAMVLTADKVDDSRIETICREFLLNK